MLASKSFRLPITGLILLLIGLVVFRDFVFGDKLLLYRDIGSDSSNSYFPDLVHLSRYIRSDGMPLWSFHSGMGQDLFQNIGGLILTPLTWFPASIIAPLLVYQHLLYVLLAGLLFYKYLELRGLSFCAALLGATLLAFSAYMSMGSCWLINAEEVVCVAFLLFSIELALVRGKWIYLPFAVALFGLLTAFYLYLCAVFLTVYVLFHMMAAPGHILSSWRRLLALSAIAVAGVGLTAPVWLDNLLQIFNSPRVSGPTSSTHTLFSSGLWAFESPQHYFTALLRPFSNDILGNADAFRGWINYFEAPISYCGVLALLLFPQTFVVFGKRARVVIALFLGAIILTTALPWFRYLFWVFEGDYYRTLTLFFVIGIITLTATVLFRYTAKQNLNLWLLFGTLAAMLALLFLPIASMQALIDPPVRATVALLLVAYATLFAAGQLLKRERLCAWIAVALCAGELSYSDWMTVSPRPTLTKGELTRRFAYNDETVEALQNIQKNTEGFYRVTKLYCSSLSEDDSLNDALVFGAFGTSSYSSFHNINFIRFLQAVDVIPHDAVEFETRWTSGLLRRPLLSSFACEKYVLTREPVWFQTSFDYDNIEKIGKVYVFQNRSFLPFGLFFDEVIPEQTFASLNTGEKEYALLHWAVVRDDAFEEIAGRAPPDVVNVQNTLKHSTVADLLRERRVSAFRMNFHKQSRVAGNIRCNAKGILVFQTPFDPGWQAIVDNVQLQTIRADVGLLGVPLAAGEHSVEMRYRPPLLLLGGMISLASVLSIAACAWRWPRIAPLTKGIAA